ncbi:hypothetical protein JYU34_011531 [Plutella xylostella]|uniref:N-acetyltransferase domain-containing protein n=1 Tax=Plutella xylostella TaxID=51655 RepID=A0ABQ7QH85_PLUXY|nr:hypothetical protein JYU34_011531 [Plutella xylostella]
MPFKRVWDDSCPKIYEQWEKNGAKYTIQDLRPEDDDIATEMFLEHFLPDEVMCNTNGIHKDALGLEDARLFWRTTMAERMSVACYRELNGKKEIVGVNACPVKCIDDEEKDIFKSDCFKQVINGMVYGDKKASPFRTLGVDKYLSGAGLMVRRDARGEGIGARLLAAREPLCRSVGITATVTIFTGPASQKSAAKAGFTDLAALTFAELADAGMKYPRDERVVIKMMAKTYD